MSDVQVIKANRSENRIRGRKVEVLRVAAYCRVSTDSEDQLNSYKSQVTYYTDLIKKKHEWTLADIYADEAITGTQVAKREDFQRMINDCMNGDIDMVITKSISRFARNTLDTLKYVRMLKEKGIAVFFEDENINTLTMDGELLLVVLSSVAQQEVENISSNVKKGLKMKMQRGELVGFQGCLGYDYHKDTKSISVNEKEAEIVRYIFNRYIEGAGCTVIGNELENLGYKTKYGSSKWVQSTVIGIIKNEKYKGDALLQKVYTVDFLSKKKKVNEGEVPQYYVENNHQAIISPSVFEEAQHQMAARHSGKNRAGSMGVFSGRIKCADCGGWYGSKVWHSNSKYRKTIWQCNHKFDGGEKCGTPHLDEETIKQLFLKAANAIFAEKDGVREDYDSIKDTLFGTAGLEAERLRLQEEMNVVAELIEQCVAENARVALDQTEYQKKYDGLAGRFNRAKGRLSEVSQAITERQAKREKIGRFVSALEKRDGPLTEFNEDDWYSLVEYATVYSREDIRFTFKNGMEIKA